MQSNFKSGQNRAINCEKFGHGPLSILIVGGVHGDEVEGIHICRGLIERIKSGTFRLPESISLWIVPEVNPDGTALNQRTNANGVDLNRNLPTQNWKAEASNPRYPPGLSAASEIETKAFIQIVSEIRPDLIVSLHSYSESLLLLPDNLPNKPIRKLVSEVAQSMNVPVADKMNYEIFGSLSRWAFEQKIPAVTVEILRGADAELVNQWTNEVETLLENSADPLLANAVQKVCAQEFDSQSAQLDSDPKSVSQAIDKLLTAKNGVITNAELETIFGVSVTLGFSIWQHLSAIERLDGLPEWKERSPLLWEQLRTGSLSCGLATTQLAKRNSITARPGKDGFLISGVAPWVTGTNFFDKIIVAFSTDEEVLFAIVDFPRNHLNVKMTPIELSSMNGTDTSSLQFSDFPITASSLISRRQKTSTVTPRPTSYVMPELGIAKACVEKLAELEVTKPDFRLKSAIEHLNHRIAALEKLRANKSAGPKETFEMGEVIRDSVRTLALFQGGKALRAGSFVSRTQANILLLDAVFQSQEAIAMKVDRAARGVTS